MKTCVLAAFSFLLLQVFSLPLLAAPTELRLWNAKGGHKVEAKALQISQGKVQLERPDGVKLVVDLVKFTDEDQATLREHFEIEEDDSSSTPATPEGEPASDLPFPLGKTTDELSCGDSHYFLYLPKSLREDAKHPVIFVMNPGGGSPGTTGRYEAAAERNRWIIAVSKESQNGFEGSQAAVDAMIEEVTSTLPIDKERMYTSGFSGGSRMAFATAQLHEDIAGVIPCGAGGDLGSSKQVAYGLCGSNCFNRTDMSNSFKGIRNKESLLRFFPGQHVWADSELIEDAATHLNGVFLIDNERDYPEQLADYLTQVTKLIEDDADNSPMRAFMWTSFLSDHKVLPAGLSEVHASLAEDPANKLYLEGLTEVSEFAQKQFGGNSGSESEIDPKVSKACLKEAAKYAGTPWENILEQMSKDAQKF